jgi:putative peptidoglycan lipid II flippase
MDSTPYGQGHMSIIKSAFTVGFWTFLSRITGFVRDMMIAGILGAGTLADISIVAFKMPNFFRRLFAEGAFNTAFVPMFSSLLAGEGRKQALVFAENVFSFMVLVLLAFTLIFEVLMPFVMVVLAPGFVGHPQTYDLAVKLTRVTFPYLMFISLVALLTGILNSFEKFSAGAIAPIFLNIVLIFSLMWWKYYMPTPAHALAWGEMVAGVVQFIWLYFECLHHKVFIRLVRPRLSPQVKKMLKLMVPGIIGGGVVQINLWVDVMIGTLIPGAVSYLYYADRVNQLPMAIIGTAIGTVLLPVLSKKIREGKLEEVIDHKNRALEFTLLLTAPATMGLLVAAHLVTATLFQRGAFGPEQTKATAFALQAFALGLPAFVMVKIFQPGYFAAHDTKTPVKIAMLCMAINVVLNLAAVFGLKRLGFYPHVGIALATTTAGWVNALLLARGLVKRGAFRLDPIAARRIAKIVFCTILMGLTVALMEELTQKLGQGEAARVTSLALVMGVAMAIYFGGIVLTRTYVLSELKAFRRKKS